jgi:hypothetical protein
MHRVFTIQASHVLLAFYRSIMHRYRSELCLKCTGRRGSFLNPRNWISRRASFHTDFLFTGGNPSRLTSVSMSPIFNINRLFFRWSQLDKSRSHWPRKTIIAWERSLVWLFSDCKTRWHGKLTILPSQLRKRSSIVYVLTVCLCSTFFDWCSMGTTLVSFAVGLPYILPPKMHESYRSWPYTVVTKFLLFAGSCMRMKQRRCVRS